MKAGDGEGADDRGSADRRSPAATGVLMRRFRFALMAFGLWLAQASGVMALPSSMIEPLAGDDAEARSAASVAVSQACNAISRSTAPIWLASTVAQSKRRPEYPSSRASALLPSTSVWL